MHKDSLWDVEMNMQDYFIFRDVEQDSSKDKIIRMHVILWMKIYAYMY